VTDPAANFATPRIAAGALFVDGDRMFLVTRPTATAGTSRADTSTQADHQQQLADER
jgi:hypothetical protein